MKYTKEEIIARRKAKDDAWKAKYDQQQLELRQSYENMIPKLPEGIPALEELCHCVGEINYGGCGCGDTGIRPTEFGLAILNLVERNLFRKRL